MVKALLKLFPHAAQEKDRLQRLSLHFAAKYQGLAVLKALLTAYLRGAQEKDWNRLPQEPLEAANDDEVEYGGDAG